jgi:hypothetical protein
VKTSPDIPMTDLRAEVVGSYEHEVMTLTIGTETTG